MPCIKLTTNDDGDYDDDDDDDDNILRGAVFTF